ncbi:hypothetical protein SCUCBS95973_002082 [Sporothrix curviconia]|uniref:Uncharacterized protein n=1 Tax=Sporothrix curviconia TaxID=1260050 RepID=A0ABP0B3W8_9PEZI
MSAYSDSVAAYAYAKATIKANKAPSPSSHYTTSSSADSVYSDSSSYYPVKDSNMASSSPKTAKSSSLKGWAKDLVSDLGKSPTARYDAAHGIDAKNYGTYDNRPTKI